MTMLQHVSERGEEVPDESGKACGSKYTKEIWSAFSRKHHIEKGRGMSSWSKDMISELNWLMRTLRKSCKAQYFEDIWHRLTQSI